MLILIQKKARNQRNALRTRLSLFMELTRSWGNIVLIITYTQIQYVFTILQHIYNIQQYKEHTYRLRQCHTCTCRLSYIISLSKVRYDTHSDSFCRLYSFFGGRGMKSYTHSVIAYFFLVVSIAHYNGLRESGGMGTNKGGGARQAGRQGGRLLRGNEEKDTTTGQTWKTQNSKHSNTTYWLWYIHKTRTCT